MLIELNKFEKRVGIFLTIAGCGMVLTFMFLAYNKGWFESKNVYYSSYKRGDGLHPGSLVTVSGINAGNVTDVDLTDDNLIKVRMKVSRRFKHKIKDDSVARIVRPFIIGDKVIDITVGSKETKELRDESNLKSMESMEIIDIFSGENLGPYLDTLGVALDKIKIIIDMLLKEGDEKRFVDLINELLPALQGLRALSTTLSSDDMKGILKGANKANTYKVMTDVDQAAVSFNKLSKTIDYNELKSLIQNMERLIGQLASVSAKIPEVTEKGIKALDEGLWVLKGMQKSWFLKSHIEEEKKKDAKNKEEKKK